MTRSIRCIALAAAFATANLVKAQDPTPTAPTDEARWRQAEKAAVEATRGLTVRLIDRSLALAESNRSLLGEVRAAVATLATRTSTLRTSEEGKRLAASLHPATAFQLQRLLTEPPVREESLKAAEAQLNSATESLRKLKADPPTGFIPSDAQQDELTRIGAELRSASGRLKARAEALDAMVQAAPTDIDVGKAPTLEAKLMEFAQRRQQESSAALAKGFDLAQPEARETLVEAGRTAALERALERSQDEVRTARIEVEMLRKSAELQTAELWEEMRRRETESQTKRSESQSWRTKQDEENRRTQEDARRQAEMIRKRQECKRPEVLAALTTFTTPGYWLPGSPLPSDQKQPMSLSALQGAGALISGPDGLKVLFKIGQDRRDTLRPRWGFRAYNGNFTLTVRNPQSYERLKAAQQYLIEYGEALVAEGYLSQ